MSDLLHRIARGLGFLGARGSEELAPENDVTKLLVALDARLRRSATHGGAPASDASIATATDVFFCFRLLLGRDPTEAEWRGHIAGVGQPLRDVVALYVQSLEFVQRRIMEPAAPEIQIVELPDFKLCIMPTDIIIGKAIAALREYEPGVTRVIQRVLRPGMAFVDVGANIGFFSMLAAGLVGSTGQVFAFEPGETNVKMLYLSRRLNDFDQITVFPFGAGSGWALSFYDRSGSNGWVTPIGKDTGDLFARSIVATAAISDVLPREQRIDLIKIDVEGCEYTALAGARPTIERWHPVIVSEFSPPALEAISGVAGEDYLRLLLDLGYRLSVVRDNVTIPCERDADRVSALFRESGEDHVDVLAE